MTTSIVSFDGLGIAPGLLGVLDSLKFKIPTPIQFKAIPIAVDGKDIIGIAQTGTGKTLAFGIPMVQKLAQSQGTGLILTPTRELALQVHEAMQPFTHAFKLRTAVLIGGESMYNQIKRLRDNPRIIVATPGRLIDHLTRRTARLNDVRVLVLDEADRMLDMGFLPQIEQILKVLPRPRQTFLFSATMPSGIVKIASTYMQLPVRTEIAPSGTMADNIVQELFMIQRDMKPRALDEILKQYKGSVLLFVRTRRAAGRVARMVRDSGHTAAEIHADRTQAQRKDALRGFKTGAFRVLVATDIAARGIDVANIELVINFDLPDDPESYVHRIGRTGRAGHEGHAITLATPDQTQEVRRIEQCIRAAIPRSSIPGVPSVTSDFSTRSGPASRPGGGPPRGVRSFRPRSGGHGRPPFRRGPPRPTRPV
ncbi:MAG: hypothetical protein A2498_05600 [Lentisphaerae bacterium RIFOXYC12_FULL_60_16]|nr:MAG: hypothetical protein A2498_05600 [Lentisphaerae bacterium RIFOXYC12_FULL_60_16]OGV73704.1 MAG: hypothetical protein A2269_00480 [Lentisphaerae bacterium RIFOXYA12_FULL_60_10]OGV75063.1 MAG: hypothetical protein A2340_14555 [Lentisphaerae bacterium RIFOXYB12_FULL_60_10]